VTGLQAVRSSNQGGISGKGWRFIYSQSVQTNFGSPKPLIQWVPTVLSQGYSIGNMTVH